MDENVRLIHFGFHRLGVRYEIGTDISAVELHTLYNIDGCIHTFGFADSDDTIFGNLAHSVGNEFADFGIIISRNGGYLLNLVEVVTYLFALLLDMRYNSLDGFVNTAF